MAMANGPWSSWSNRACSSVYLFIPWTKSARLPILFPSSWRIRFINEISIVTPSCSRISGRELCDIARQRGFIPVAAGAFIGEHSYSSAAQPIAHGRPDEADLEKARAFGAAIRKKLDGLDSAIDAGPVDIPGNFPYLEPEGLHRLKALRQTVAYVPETDMSRCTMCETCMNICPGEAIDRRNPSKTEKDRCILCFACVKGCREGARSMNKIATSPVVKLIHETCGERKEPEYYL